MQKKLLGMYSARVVNDVDPERRSRIQIEMPALGVGSRPWAEACVVSNQPASPRIGDVVWVMFEAGDARLPVWVGIRPPRGA